MIETARGFVNSWECDENRHMNVQFYLRRFETASAILAALAGTGLSDAALVKSRHVRYHRELLEADCVRTVSGTVTEGRYAGRVLHAIYHTGNGALCATALDELVSPDVSARLGELSSADPDLTALASPRGLGDDAIEAPNYNAMLASGDAIISFRHVLGPADCDRDGNILSSTFISCFTDGAPHAWDLTGLTGAWLQGQNFGRVAVELKLQRCAEACPGDILEMVSWAGDIHEKNFRISHVVRNMVTGEVLALGQVRNVVLDLETRRVVKLPGFVHGAA
jgi:acyl-CoA thioester hydrolase